MDLQGMVQQGVSEEEAFCMSQQRNVPEVDVSGLAGAAGSDGSTTAHASGMCGIIFERAEVAA